MKKIFYLIFFLLPFFLAAQNPVPYKGTGYIYFTDSTIMQTYVPLNATGSERAILRSNSTSANPHENREFAYEGPVLKWVEQLPGSGGTSGDGGTVFRTNSVTPTSANVFPLGVPWTTNDRLDMLRNGSFAYWSGSAWIKNSMDNGFNVPNSLRVTATQDTTSYTPNLNKGNRFYFAIDPGVANIQTPDSLDYQGDGEIFVYQLQNVGGDTCIVVFENTTYREIPPGASVAAALDTFILASGEQMYLNFQVTTLGEILVLQVMSSPNREWVNQEIAAAGSDYVLKAGDTMTGNLYMTSNKIIGGSTTTSDLNLQTTSGVGATGADMHFLVGNNGATEAMTIKNNGQVGIGNPTPGFTLDIISSSTNIVATRYSDNTVESVFRGRKARGTVTTPLPLLSGDAITTYYGTGYDGTSFPANLAGLRISARENFTPTTCGTSIDFMTTDIGTISMTQKMILSPPGLFGIGTTSPDRLLHPELADATTNTVTYPFRLSKTTSGTAATGFGLGIEFEQEGADGANDITATINAVATDATAGSEDEKMIIGLARAGTLTDALSLTSTGDIQPSGGYIDKDGDLGTSGQVLSSTGTLTDWITAGGGSGTVTSVDGSGGTTGLTLTGGPITTSGTLTLGGVLNKANGGSGSSGDVFWELSTSQVPTGNKRITGTFFQGSGTPISGSSFGSTDGTYNTFFSGTAAFDETNFVNSEALALYSQQTNSTAKVKTYIVGFGNDTGNIGSTLNFGTRVHGSAGNVTFPIVVDGLQNLLNGATGAGGQGTCINGELGIEDGGGGSWDFDATISGGGTLDLAFGGAVQAFMVQGGGGIWTPSDKRLKTEIRELSVLDNIEEMRGVRYTFKKSGKKSIGVIAQEIQKFFPEAVTKSSNGFLAVDYQAVAAIALQGAKESSEKIDLLENQIFDLHKRLENLETQAGIIPRKKMGFLKRVFGKY